MSLVSHSYSVGYGNFGLANVQVATAVGDQEVSGSVALPAATTDHFQPLNLGATTANIKALLLQTSGNTVTVETNNITGSGGDSLTVVPGYPLLWVSGMPNTRPLTAALTSGLYLTNAGTVTGTFSYRFLIDPTGP